jgi:hypothetical protein
MAAPGASACASESGGGILHDQLWCKYAFEHLSEKLGNKDSARNGQVFSLGPQLKTSQQDFVRALESYLDPEADSRVDEVMTFDFAGSVGLGSGGAGDEEFTDVKDLFIFRIDSTSAHRQKVLPTAHRVNRSDAILISKAHVLSSVPALCTLRIALEALGTAGADQLHVMTAGTLSVDDFATLRVWDTGNLHYSFRNCRLPEERDHDVQDIVKGILDARRAAADGLFIYDAKDDVFRERKITLDSLEKLGVVSQSPLGDRSGWTLSPKGKESLQLGLILANPRLFFKPDSDIDLMDMSTFDLMSALQADGWACTVKHLVKQKARRKDTRQPKLTCHQIETLQADSTKHMFNNILYFPHTPKLQAEMPSTIRRLMECGIVFCLASEPASQLAIQQSRSGQTSRGWEALLRGLRRRRRQGLVAAPHCSGHFPAVLASATAGAAAQTTGEAFHACRLL